MLIALFPIYTVLFYSNILILPNLVRRDLLKKLLLFYLVALLFIMGCSSTSETQTYQIDSIEVQQTEPKVSRILITKAEVLKPLDKVLNQIQWQDGQAKIARNPDVSLHIDDKNHQFYYDVFFSSDGTAQFIDEEAHKLGSLREDYVTQFKSLIQYTEKE